MNVRSLLAPVVLFLAGCAGLGNDGRGYPSLVRRPIESAGVPNTSPSPVLSSTAPVVDGALPASIADLTGKARKGAAAFDANYPKAAAKVRAAQGLAVVSENWSVANIALGQLEASRNESVFALAGLETLYVERMNVVASGKVSGGVEAIDEARLEALAIVDSQNDRMDALKVLLRAP